MMIVWLYNICHCMSYPISVYFTIFVHVLLLLPVLYKPQIRDVITYQINHMIDMT